MPISPFAAITATQRALVCDAVLMELAILTVCWTVGRQIRLANRIRVLRANIAFAAGIIFVMIATGIPGEHLALKLMLYADVLGLVIVASISANQAGRRNLIGRQDFSLRPAGAAPAALGRMGLAPSA